MGLDSPDGLQRVRSNEVSVFDELSPGSYGWFGSYTISSHGSSSCTAQFISPGLLYVLREFRCISIANTLMAAYVYHNSLGMGYFVGTGMIHKTYEKPFCLWYVNGDSFSIILCNEDSSSRTLRVIMRFDTYPLPSGFVPRPVCSFSISDNTPVVGQSVVFTDTSIGDIDIHVWSFGDHTYSSLASPTHTYLSPGTYTVEHEVQGRHGSDYSYDQVVVS